MKSKQIKKSKFINPSAFGLLALTSFILYILSYWCSPNNYLALEATEIIKGHLPNLSLIYQLFTYQFAHAGFRHFAGNFAFATPFALIAERKLGFRKFLNLWFFSGICAALLFICAACCTPLIQTLCDLGMPVNLVGASGSIFGIVTYTCLTVGTTLWQKLGARCLLAFYVIPQIVATLISINTPQSIAFAGHVGGFIGALIWLACEAHPLLQKAHKKI